MFHKRMINYNRVKEDIVAIICYSMLTIIMTYPLVFSLNDGVPASSGDVWQFIWDFWWFKKALIDLRANPFYTDYLYYPNGTSLLFNLNMPLHSLLSIPLQYLFNLFFVYNFFVILSFILSSYGTYLLIRYLTRDYLVSLVGGFIFGFSPFRFVRLFAGHLYLLDTSFIPFYIMYLIKSVQNPNLKNRFLTILFLVLVLFSSLTYFTFLILFTGIYYIWYLFNNRKDIFRKVTKNLSITFILFFIITSPYFFILAKEYFTVPYKDLHRSIDESEFYSADLIAFFIPLTIHPIFGKYVTNLWDPQGINNLLSGNWNEGSVFIGYTVMLLVIFSFIKIKGEGIGFWKIAFISFLILSLGPFLHILGKDEFTSLNFKIPLPYLILFNTFPFFDVSRGPSRFIVLVMLSASVLGSYSLHKINIRFKRFFIIFIFILILVENLVVPIPIKGNDWVSEFFYEMGKEDDDYAYLNLFPHHVADYLYLQVVSNKRDLMGFISRHPLYIENFVSKTPILRQLVYEIPSANGEDIGISESEIEEGLLTLKSYNIKYIVLHKSNIKPKIFKGYTNFIENLNLTKRYEDDKIIVYRVPN
ncbi:MAG: hypothetical protein DRO90_00555 [Candidatus Altiarchaeales archaeon]|nr:MAG: hypothetical protein DRO90_00555 [Candidatus Altiarchaeales archaeon]